MMRAVRNSLVVACIATVTGTLVATMAASEGVEPKVDEFWHVEPTFFDAHLVGLIDDEVRALGLPVRRMTAGASKFW